MLHYFEEDAAHSMQYNYTFHLDLCNRLNSKRNGHCHNGARVCAEREDIPVDGNSTFHNIDIAGTFTTIDSKQVIDAKFTLLSKSGSNADVDRQGVRAELHGGKYPFKKEGKDQMAVIEFVCDPERSGLEGDEKDEEGDSPGDDDNKDGDDQDKDGDKKEERRWDLGKKDQGGKGKCSDSDASLRFCGYGPEDDDKTKVDVLRLEWRTKYACKDAPSDSSGSWGFFTWFIIILFLAVASYLIFGSWLNYNRYGARGWDLLPHGDTLRDVPYIMKDWARALTNKFQGPGSRGGYSAVSLP